MYKTLVPKSQGKRPLKKPKYRWKDNIELDLGKIDFEDMDGIDLAQVRVRLWSFVT
jgi:hypothetical protein